MTSDTKRLPPHIMEADVTAVAEMVGPTFHDSGWNGALEAISRGLEALDARQMLTLSNALEIIDSIRRPEGADQ